MRTIADLAEQARASWRAKLKFPPLSNLPEKEMNHVSNYLRTFKFSRALSSVDQRAIRQCTRPNLNWQRFSKFDQSVSGVGGQALRALSVPRRVHRHPR